MWSEWEENARNLPLPDEVEEDLADQANNLSVQVVSDEEDSETESTKSNMSVQSVRDEENKERNLENKVAKILKNNLNYIENLSVIEKPRIWG